MRETISAALALQIGLVAFFWKRLPAQLPSHFGPGGAPDAWGDRSMLAILPLVALFLYGILTLVSFFPGLWNYPVQVTEENRARLQAVTAPMLGWIKLELVLTFLYITWGSIRGARGEANGLGVWLLPVILGALGVTIAVSVLRMRRLA